MKEYSPMKNFINGIIACLIVLLSVQNFPQQKYSLVIHGGAGTFNKSYPDSVKQLYINSLTTALKLGEKILASGGSAIDAVEAVIVHLEDDSLFNAGRGAVLNEFGNATLDASIMNGKDLSCGGVADVKLVKNPIKLARTVMEKTDAVLIVSDGAEYLAKNNGFEMVENNYFVTFGQKQSWEKRKEKEQKGTVGAVALDMNGNLAAGTSTGGRSFKKFGRVGDSPIIGAGNYADNRTCAISATGWGEKYIKNAVAFHISALMLYKNYSLNEATNHIMNNVLDEGDGGVIAIDKDGNYSMLFTTESMLRGVVNSEGVFEVMIW